VPAACSADGTPLAVEINGIAVPARVTAAPLYDPSGSRMRA
jgi:glycine cleavage system aminomethyltransferase T